METSEQTEIRPALSLFEASMFKRRIGERWGARQGLGGKASSTCGCGANVEPTRNGWGVVATTWTRYLLNLLRRRCDVEIKRGEIPRLAQFKQIQRANE